MDQIINPHCLTTAKPGAEAEEGFSFSPVVRLEVPLHRLRILWLDSVDLWPGDYTVEPSKH